MVSIILNVLLEHLFGYLEPVLEHFNCPLVNSSLFQVCNHYFNLHIGKRGVLFPLGFREVP
jgi:hypothetical protein